MTNLPPPDERHVVLVALAEDDADAAHYRNAIDADPELRARVDLRFGRADEAASILSQAEVVTCGNLTHAQVDAAPNLRWISYWSAGMDGKVTPQLLERGLLLTNASGIHGAPIAEHVMAFMLMFTRRMETHLRSQISGRWERGLPANKSGADELTGQTLGIVGLGRIGEALAARAKAFDMRVVGAKRSPEVRHGTGAIDAVYGLDEIPRLLGESDHICIALPYTAETHHLFDAAMIAHCKPGAYLYNIARGKIVDEPALVEALRTERLSGAGLDVFETEPLPSESPLWSMQNVLITPHTAGISPYYFRRAAAQFAANLKRYLGRLPLTNLYEHHRGY